MRTIILEAIEFDSAKDRLNRLKHGHSLAEAIYLDWDSLLAVIDDRFSYGEIRVVGYAPIGERLFCVVFTERGERHRIISLRKANVREVKRYVQARENS